MSRIVIDARELRTSSGRYVERLLHYLQDADNTNSYIVLLNPIDFEGWQPHNQSFSKVLCPIKEFTIAEQTSLQRQIETLKPDLIHFAFPQQPIRLKGRTITTIHDLTTLRFDNPSKNKLVFRFKRRVYALVIKRSVKKASLVITPTEFTKNDLLKFSGISPDKVHVTYESADYINEQSVPVIELDGKRFIMYVGRPTPHKNLERLIQAFSLLSETYPDLCLALAGRKDDNYRGIEASLPNNSVNKVIFTDFVSEGQLKWMYEHCSAYIFPSLSEGFGLPGLEAMVHGAPVVSSNASCLPEVYGDAAEYFDPLDINGMAKAISRVLDNQNLHEQLIKKGRRQAAKYSWARMAEQTLELYKRALAE